jgi:probable F420-dependent oxidoreductase
MKIGMVYPQMELNVAPQNLRQIGTAADELNYDHLLMYDHVIGAVHENRDPPLVTGGADETHPFHEPMVAFGYLAGITSKIDFMTGILILPQRQTALVAKQAAEVDLLSGGRLHLGVGIGWNHVEYQALGQDFRVRGQRMEEQVDFLRRLWAEPLVTFDGKFDQLDRGAIVPRPERRIPIYCGGFTEPSFKRGAKIADGFIFVGPMEEAVLPSWGRVQHHLRNEGRDTQEFAKICIIQSGSEQGQSVQQAVDAIRRWQDAGGTHASVGTLGNGFTTAQNHIDYLAEVRQRLDL